MKTTETPFNERVVKLTEVCEGVVTRTFYCIHDADFGHWMSTEPFDRAIWTKDVRCRREFDSRRKAEYALIVLMDWREDPDGERDDLDDIFFKPEAA